MESMTLPARGAKRTSVAARRRKREPDNWHPAASLITKITEENRTYKVRVEGVDETLHAWRVGHDWYHGTGEYLTTSASIATIRVAARVA